MGHLAAKDYYRKLGKKIDGLTMRVPWNDTLYAILKELYSHEEAEVVAKMPYGLSTLDQIIQATHYDKTKLQSILDGLCAKGLVMDIWFGGKYHYAVSPMIVGVFEFTMMRTKGELNTKEWARLFHEYLGGNDIFHANFGKGQKVSPLRALPHEETLAESEYVEILDYEKASAIIDQSKNFSIGICSCRHEKLHAGVKTCDIPLETCSTFGNAAEYMVKYGFGKAVTKSEMFDNIARSKEMGLVLCADNVKKDISFICHCCGCCCNVLLGISKFGYPNTVVTSNYIANSDKDICTECGTCAETCPIKAISMTPNGNPEVDEAICLGCGVCGLKCPSGAMKLKKRQQKVLHPEDTFQRVILQSLERGTLQNLLFSDTQRTSHKFLRTFVGAFLKVPPVKKALIGDKFRSSFLEFMQKGAR